MPLEQEPAAQPDRFTPSLLVCDSTGAAVADLLKALIGLGYDLGAAGVDGVFGRSTKAAVETFQRANGVTIDGKVRMATRAAIGAETLSPPPPDVQPTDNAPASGGVFLALLRTLLSLFRK